MTIDKEIEDLQSAVVSQLVTRKPAHGIPLDAIVRDYNELNGEHIPYHRYGYSTLVDFLKTIPEIEVYSRGVTHFINFKGKESFKHVTDLVARTQTKTSRNYKGPNRSRSIGMRKTVPPGYKPPQEYNNRPYESTSSSSSIIDPAVTSEILSIIKECPSGLFLSELLEKLYNRSRLNLSNNQIQEHLKMLEREVTTKDNMIYLRKSSPWDSFAHKSSRSQSVPPRRHNNNQRKYSNETSGNRNYDKYVKNNSDYNNLDENNGNGNYQSNYGNTSTEINYSKNASSKNFKIAGVDSDEDLNNDYCNDFDSGPSFAENEYIGIHPTNVKNNETQYHGKSGDTISDSREKDPEKIYYKHDSSYNHNNTYESKVRSSNYHNESEAVNPKVNTSDDITKAENIDREILFQKNKKFVIESLSQRTVLRLQKLLENNPNGIWCLDLPTLYEKEYKLSLDWGKSNCQRFSDFVSYLPHIFHKIGPYRRGDYKLFDARKPIPDDDDDKIIKQTPTLASVYNSYNSQNYYDESIPRRLSREVRRKLFPLDVINDEETIECIQVSEFSLGTNELGRKEYRFIEVNVVEAFDPSFFWVQLSRNKDDFDDMMERLGTFYDENSSKYAIPQVLLVEKLNVACKFYGTWHRGMIKSVSPSLSSAKIHFYDFGTMKSYRADELFFLKRSFGILPAQAIPCGLAGIEPKVHTGEGNGWPVEARDVFIKLAFKCEMWAMVQKIDVDNNSMLIGLTDTSEPEDLHIADFLLRHKLAAKSNTNIVVDPNDMSLYVEDYGENSTNNITELLQPTPQISSTPSTEVSCASPTIQNSSAIPNSGVTTPNNVPSAAMWETVREKIIQVLDQYTQSAVSLYKSMIVADMESKGLEIIRSTFYELYAKLFYQTISSINCSETPTVTCTPNHPASKFPPELIDLFKRIKDQSLSETRSIADSEATLTNERNDSDIFDESFRSLPIDNASNLGNSTADTTSTLHQVKTDRVRLENSITQASLSFFQKLNEQKSSMEVPSDFIETNPFKQDIMSSITQKIKNLPPLPPRPKKEVIKSAPPKTNFNFGVSTASPVLYDIPEKITDELEEPTTDMPAKNPDPIEPVKSSIPVYNNILINPVGINRQRNENYEEDSWDSKSSYSVCGPIDATTAESIEKDSSYSYSDQLSRSTDKLYGSIKNNNPITKKNSNPIPFKTVNLTTGDVIIYNFANSGWILIDQYRRAFTVYDDNKFILTMIELKSANIPVKKITFDEYPQIFEQYRNSSERFRENDDLEILDFIPMSHVLKLSQKLSVVTRDEIERIKNRNYDVQLSVNMIDLLKLISNNELFINE
ncbi:uncharacterized protein LOC123272477 isoform X5 [Cotesia glomerata]|uniref:uncharacterized protein LOC123272477 isoform X5 n=1 Tax=Cotesia glomerata TaxID=32391 RepID=UPI001D0243BD|nr:uncharacterized protein LOC123272477 isoform X5 [Cotesia glomerata]